MTSEKKYILLIDDDQIIHLSCEMVLYGSRYELISIASPDEALQYPKHKDRYTKPDLILVDFMIEKISGIDVIEVIRKDSSFDNTPIILFTGYREQIIKNTEVLKRLNIACVLAKPILKEEMLAKLNEYIF